MKFNFLLTIFFVPILVFGQQVGINTEFVPDDAVLNIESGNKGGIAPPVLTSEQRNQLPGNTEGLFFYNSTTQRFEMRKGSGWTGLDGGLWNPQEGTINIWHDPGYVGIQAQHPESPLHVAGAQDIQLTVHRTGIANGKAQIVLKNTNGGIYMGMNESYDFGISPLHTGHGAMLNIQQNKPGELKVNGQEGGIIPRGGIIMWSGNPDQIPAGWALCNGSNNTPDLRGKFVVGYNPSDGDYNHTRKTGGAAQVALTENQLPRHSHSLEGGSTNAAGDHAHDFTLRRDAFGTDGGFYIKGGSFGSYETRRTETEGEHTHSLTGRTQTAGNGQAHENRPPYYVIAYIIKL